MTRRIRRDDPAYLAAMREAKELFDAEMAKSAMKSRGRPPAPAAAAAAELGIDEADLPDEVAEVPEGEPAEAPATPARRARRQGDTKNG